MWEEEEDNLKISSTPDLALSHDEAAAMALAAGVLQNSCSVLLQHMCRCSPLYRRDAAFSSANRKLKTFLHCVLFFL